MHANVLLMSICRKVKCIEQKKRINCWVPDGCTQHVENAENVCKGQYFQWNLNRCFFFSLSHILASYFGPVFIKCRAPNFQWHLIWYKNAGFIADMASVEFTQSNDSHHPFNRDPKSNFRTNKNGFQIDNSFVCNIGICQCRSIDSNRLRSTGCLFIGASR